jgi:hypothetical protein
MHDVEKNTETLPQNDRGALRKSGVQRKKYFIGKNMSHLFLKADIPIWSGFS